MTNKNKYTIPYMVNGFISQFTIHVIIKPFGFFPTCFTLWESTFNIMGYIITHIRTTIGMDIHSISNFPRALGTNGKNLPIRTPITIHRKTHMVRYLWKKFMP
jgi:hypothetical protein